MKSIKKYLIEGFNSKLASLKTTVECLFIWYCNDGYYDKNSKLDGRNIEALKDILDGSDTPWMNDFDDSDDMIQWILKNKNEVILVDQKETNQDYEITFRCKGRLITLVSVYPYK